MDLLPRGASDRPSVWGAMEGRGMGSVRSRRHVRVLVLELMILGAREIGRVGWKTACCATTHGRFGHAALV